VDAIDTEGAPIMAQVGLPFSNFRAEDLSGYGVGIPRTGGIRGLAVSLAGSRHAMTRAELMQTRSPLER